MEPAQVDAVVAELRTQRDEIDIAIRVLTRGGGVSVNGSAPTQAKARPSAAAKSEGAVVDDTTFESIAEDIYDALEGKEKIEVEKLAKLLSVKRVDSVTADTVIAVAKQTSNLVFKRGGRFGPANVRRAE